MKRMLVVVVAVLAVALGAGLADAKIKGGTFKGKTNKGDPITLKVKKNKVVRFTFTDVRLHCSESDPFNSGKVNVTVAGKINKKRRFEIHATNADRSQGSDIKGRFKRSGNKASGTLRVFANYDSQGNSDPNGSDRCTTGKLTWKVKRQ